MKKALAGAAGALVLTAGGTTTYLLTTGSGTSTPFSFQQAYDAAADGAVITVPGGQVVTDAPARGSATIFASTPAAANKSVTFTCAGGDVTFNPQFPRLTIKAYNVTLRGSCFRLRDLWIGEPGDSARSAGNVTIDGVHMEGLQIVGTEATVVNSEIGPQIACYAQGTTGTGSDGGAITPSMWCDPNGPPAEADYAQFGSQNINRQSYFHNNAGGVPAKVDFERNYVHDIQTKDAFNLHTGCGLVWQANGPANPITIKDNRFERCAVLGLLFQGSPAYVTISGNTFGPPMEPFSNVGDGVQKEAGTFAKELTCKSGAVCSNWDVSNNVFCHGTRADGASGTSVSFSGNDLGIADAPWSFATYSGNTHIGGSCSSVTPPPTTTTTTTTTPTTTTSSTTTTSTTTTTQPPPPDPDRVLFCNEFVPSIQGNSYYSKWKAANPGELSRWEPYRDGLCNGQSPSAPTMKTLYGKALVAAGKEAA